MEGLPVIPEARIYMFKGDTGYEPETTTEEINSFIQQNLPAPEQATSTKDFSYPDYLISTKKSNNSDMQAAAD